jgi:hypothetical protein
MSFECDGPGSHPVYSNEFSDSINGEGTRMEMFGIQPLC